MNRVYIIGSGFSRAVSQHMPILSELSVGIQRELERPGKPALPGSDTPIAQDFERWLSYLVEAPPWLTPGDVYRNLAAFEDIAESLHTVLSTAQIKAMEARVPDWLLDLVKYWQATQATVITFNYDLLVETAWYVAHPKLSANGMYGVPLMPAESRVGAVLHPGQTNAGMRLLKLHGSLSWWYSGVGSPPGDAVYDVGIGRSGWTHSDFTEVDSDASVVDKRPLIVPPAAVKSPYYGNQIIRSLWAQAATAMRSAEELVVMGFSFPPSDQIVGSLIATELAPSAVIVPVDREKYVVDNIRRIMGSRTSDIDENFICKDAPISGWVRKFANLGSIA